MAKLILISITQCLCCFWCSLAFAQHGTTPPQSIDIWNLPALQVHPGAYEANWESLSRYEVPDWYRDAKFGIWAHWDPQSVPEQGDWYARKMYIEGDRNYRHCLETYGHPSEFGYKDLCALWTCDRWVIHTLVENVSKNGNLLLNIPQRAQGNVDPEAEALPDGEHVIEVINMENKLSVIDAFVIHKE